MSTPRLLSPALALLVALSVPSARAQQEPAAPQPSAAKAVVINGKTLTGAQVKALESAVRGPVCGPAATGTTR